MEQETTIQQLRRSGYKVRVIHGVLSEDDEYYDIADKITTIEVLDPQGREWKGEARCSLKDHYNRKLGNKIALQRALKKMNQFYLGKTIDNATNQSTFW